MKVMAKNIFLLITYKSEKAKKLAGEITSFVRSTIGNVIKYPK